MDDKQKAILEKLSRDIPIDTDDESGKIELWLNDTFCVASSDVFEVKPEELEVIERLFRRYGFCGVYYWASKKDGIRSSFLDINRFIDFVAKEEQLVADIPDSSKRAYNKISYLLGENK